MAFASKIKNIIFATLLVYSTVFHGAYFLGPLIVINIYLLFSIFFHKDEIKIDIIALLLMLLWVVMVCSWLLFSLSLHEGFIEILKYAIFPLAYIYFKNVHTDKIDGAFFKVFVLIMIFGLLGVIGISPLPGMAASGTGRLQSFLGYANTAALIMGIGAFYATERFKTTKSKIQLILAAGFLAGLIFTLSRVTFVTFVLIYLLYIFRSVSLKPKIIATSGVALIWIVLALFDSRIVDISFFSPTLVERYISYFDALRVMLLHPFGLGVSNWQFMQFYYQSAPYSVRFIHNFYLQIGVDGGFLALGLIIAALALALVKAEKNLHFYIAIFILSGAFFEVHFNFGLIIVYFAYVLKEIMPQQGWFFAISFAKPTILRYAVIIPVIPLVVMFISNSFYNTGARHESSRNPQAAYTAYSNALSVSLFNNSGLHFALSRTSPDFQTAMFHLYNAHTLNPWDTNIIFSLAQGHLHGGNLELAYHYGSTLIDKFPFSTRNQEFLYGVANALESPNREIALESLENRIQEINADINTLFRHIDPYFQY